MQGNRDFLYGEAFARRVGGTLIPDPSVVTLFGERVLLTHGDLLCTGDAAYQELRSTVRDPKFRARVMSLSVEARQLLANAARAGSKAHTRATAATIMDVTPSAVVAAFEASDTLKMIHGHTHRPGEHRHVTRHGEAERVVLAAWDEAGEFLDITAGGWQRKRVN
jgi:UDP-2,3-diacylglucosamine hydrolase